MDIEALYEPDLNIMFEKLDKANSSINETIDFQSIEATLKDIKKHVR